MKVLSIVIVIFTAMVVLCGCGQNVMSEHAEELSTTHVKIVKPMIKEAVLANWMEKCQFKEIYPIYVKELSKNEIAIETLDDLCRYFNNQIGKHPFAKYILTFDNYAHTSALNGGTIGGNIIGAKVVLFCFGKKLLDPKIVAVRPRAIGLCETETHFVISFLEVPNPSLTETMIKWVHDLTVQKIGIVPEVVGN